MNLQTEPKEQVIRYMKNMHNMYLHSVKHDQLLEQTDKEKLFEFATDNYNQTILNLTDFGDLSVKDYQLKRVKQINDVHNSVNETLELFCKDVFELLKFEALEIGLIDGHKFLDSMKQYADLIMADIESLNTLD